MAEIKITNEHTFNNWGTFDINHDGNIYKATWEQRGSKKNLETDAPKEIYKRVYAYLFDEA